MAHVSALLHTPPPAPGHAPFRSLLDPLMIAVEDPRQLHNLRLGIDGDAWLRHLLLKASSPSSAEPRKRTPLCRALALALHREGKGVSRCGAIASAPPQEEAADAKGGKVPLQTVLQEVAFAFAQSLRGLITQAGVRPVFVFPSPRWGRAAKYAHKFPTAAQRFASASPENPQLASPSRTVSGDRGRTSASTPKKGIKALLEDELQVARNRLENAYDDLYFRLFRAYYNEHDEVDSVFAELLPLLDLREFADQVFKVLDQLQIAWHFAADPSPLLFPDSNLRKSRLSPSYLAVDAQLAFLYRTGCVDVVCGDRPSELTVAGVYDVLCDFGVLVERCVDERRRGKTASEPTHLSQELAEATDDSSDLHPMQTLANYLCLTGTPLSLIAVRTWRDRLDRHPNKEFRRLFEPWADFVHHDPGPRSAKFVGLSFDVYLPWLRCVYLLSRGGGTGAVDAALGVVAKQRKERGERVRAAELQFLLRHPDELNAQNYGRGGRFFGGREVTTRLREDEVVGFLEQDGGFAAKDYLSPKRIGNRGTKVVGDDSQNKYTAQRHAGGGSPGAVSSTRASGSVSTSFVATGYSSSVLPSEFNATATSDVTPAGGDAEGKAPSVAELLRRSKLSPSPRRRTSMHPRTAPSPLDHEPKQYLSAAKLDETATGPVATSAAKTVKSLYALNAKHGQPQRLEMEMNDAQARRESVSGEKPEDDVVYIKRGTFGGGTDMYYEEEQRLTGISSSLQFSRRQENTDRLSALLGIASLRLEEDRTDPGKKERPRQAVPATLLERGLDSLNDEKSWVRDYLREEAELLYVPVHSFNTFGRRDYDTGESRGDPETESYSVAPLSDCFADNWRELVWGSLVGEWAAAFPDVDLEREVVARRCSAP